jgi:pSer/pThr/pTyr-binding forkhead associated (FHA) protein
VDIKISVQCEVEGQPRSYDLEFCQDTVSIGSADENDVQLPDSRVAAEHARIVHEGDRMVLVDLGEATGTMVDGRPVESGSSSDIDFGTEIRIAAYRLIMACPEVKLDESTSEKTSMVAMQMVREVLGSLGGQQEPPFFEVLNDAEKGTRLELGEDDKEYRIGREKSCELILKHWSISRKHALVRRSGGQTMVADLGSKNGVALNGDRITEPKALKNEDVVSVGHTELRYRDPGSPDLSDDRTPALPLDLLEPELLREPDPDVDSTGSIESPPPVEGAPTPTTAAPAPRSRTPLIVGGIALLVALAVVVVLLLL